MSNATPPSPAGDPVPAMDLSPYTQVVIVKTDEISGHEYRRGSRHSVDAVTLTALRKNNMVADDDATG